MEIPDEDGRQESLSRLVEDIAYFDEQMAKAKDSLDAAKAALVSRLDGKEFTAENDSYTVSVSYRGEGRKVDVISLVRAGYRKEQFSSVKPTITALQKLAEEEEWPLGKTEHYILPDKGPKKGYVRIDRKTHDEEEYE